MKRKNYGLNASKAAQLTSHPTKPEPEKMNIDELGKRTGIECIDAYNRSGLILDLYLSGKITRQDAESWALELKAEYVQQYLGMNREP